LIEELKGALFDYSLLIYLFPIKNKLRGGDVNSIRLHKTGKVFYPVFLVIKFIHLSIIFLCAG